ncbi:uncharacterized protein LOC117102817 [Anneissia japonica]|uniref:uncharacterized protein LOC117102817 n=1 Tax=Anneissia japonica TaxID=1529436 RepID=UPI00142596D3|nr:uncharacterized protein LOC117102817 [Anneissia japonica]
MFKMPTTSVLTIVILIAVLALYHTHGKHTLSAAECRQLKIFDQGEIYSKEQTDCSNTKTKEWAQNILDYFERNKNKTDKRWKIEQHKEEEQAMYIIDCILHSNSLSFNICDKI